MVARDTADQTGPASAATTVRTTGGGGGGENPGGNGKINLGYFTNWGSYTVKNLVTSGSAEKITHINYAFGNVQNGKCTIGDAYEDYAEVLHRRPVGRRQGRRVGTSRCGATSTSCAS
ncbi:hypothetical protein SBADM41S_01605 [Streptomyces badius]